MAITDRKLFAGALPKINSRGTGITSGLVDDDPQFSSDFEQQRRILQSTQVQQFVSVNKIQESTTKAQLLKG